VTEAIRVGRLTVVAQPDRSRLARLAARLAARGYEVRESPHFAVGRRDGVSVLAHPFTTSTVDEDVAPLVAEELGPLGLVSSAREYGEALFAIVASTSPSAGPCPKCGRVHVDLATVWRHYSVNTLRRLRALLATPPGAPARVPATHTEQFAAVYRRVIDACAGRSLLDVGTSLGFLPVLLGELRPDIRVAGCDNRQDAVTAAADLAAVAGAAHVTFSVRDVLAPEFAAVGTFDTVTAVHVLEHLTEAELPVALTSLLGVTARRLILAVPYEAVAEPLYGHEQVFTLERLRSLGERCVSTLGGGRFQCEDVCGGLLIYDRPVPQVAGVSATRPNSTP
jgi:SAM-dependent methyltransferase